MTDNPNPHFSTSEDHGIKLLTNNDKTVYSVGISTGGTAEIRMAELAPRHIVASTIDQVGLRFASERITENGLGEQIELKLEDVAEPLPYEDAYFDYIYARLVLHYLPKDKLASALSNLSRILKPEGRLFIVVRSDKCEHAHMPDSIFDPVTELTEYTETDPKRGIVRLQRHFFSENELANKVKEAGFLVDYAASFDEHLFKDFLRTVPDTRTDNLVELLAIKK